MSEAEQGGRLPLKPLGGTTYTWDQVREQARRAFLAGWEKRGRTTALELVAAGSAVAESEAAIWVSTWLPGDEGRHANPAAEARPPDRRLDALGRVEVLERRLDALERTTNEGLAARAMAHEVDAMGVAFERRVAELESRVLAAGQALGGGA